MTSCKLILHNVRKHIRDYLVYFLTLMISVSLFYAFNSISDQTAFLGMSDTKTLLFDQLGRLISLLSFLIAVVLSFLIVYADQFLLKRRKKELGIYMMSGMKKTRISFIFAGETLCVGFLSLCAGLGLGLVLSQGMSVLSLKLFAADLSRFRFVLSGSALRQTVLCFAVIFLLVMLFNIRSVSSVKLIDLLSAERKTENASKGGALLGVPAFLLSLILLGVSFALFLKNGILPSRENLWFQTAAILLAAGTLLFFWSVSTASIRLLQADSRFYLKGLNTFLVRQVAGRIRTNHLVLSVICGLLTLTICAVTVGVSTALAMNSLAQAASPCDLCVTSEVDRDGDTEIADYLSTQGIDMGLYAEEMIQINARDSGLTYGELFRGQDLSLWSIDRGLSDVTLYAISLSDFNRAMALQGKAPYSLGEDEFLLNCNYEGTLGYVRTALEQTHKLVIAGTELKSASDAPLEETWFMTSVVNNDRGTLIVPDRVAENLSRDMNVLLVRFKPDADSRELIQKLIPIGLDDAHSYRYMEKEMMYDTYFGSNAMIVFLCTYLGVTFLLICAAVLALKQLTETADGIRRYDLLQKLGASPGQISRTLLKQTAFFFLTPLAVAAIFSAVFMRKAIETVEEFMNIHISTNVGFTAALFLLVYGVYFLAAYLSCRRMVREKRRNIS